MLTLTVKLESDYTPTHIELTIATFTGDSIRSVSNRDQGEQVQDNASKQKYVQW